MENTKRTNDYECDQNHIIHSLFGDHPVTIRFTKIFFALFIWIY